MKKETCYHKTSHETVVQRVKENILSSSDVERVCEIFRVLSEPSRMKIVLALLQGEMCVYHITDACNSTQSAVSHQLRILRDKKIVKATRVGQNMEYSIIDEHIREIVETGLKHLRCEVEL